MNLLADDEHAKPQMVHPPLWDEHIQQPVVLQRCSAEPGERRADPMRKAGMPLRGERFRFALHGFPAAAQMAKSPATACEGFSLLRVGRSSTYVGCLSACANAGSPAKRSVTVRPDHKDLSHKDSQVITAALQRTSADMPAQCCPSLSQHVDTITLFQN